MHSIRIITAILSILMFSSCAMMTPTPPQPEKEIRPSGSLPPGTRPTYNLSGYPGAMKEGYIDGCETAKNTRYGQKNEKLYAIDGQYQLGWDDGFDMCKDQAE